LVRYLLMVRKKVKEPKVDSELLYAYARINNLGEIDSFLHTSHQANLQQVGDRCVRVCVNKQSVLHSMLVGGGLWEFEPAMLLLGL
jgi:hypothetical protein